MKLFFLALLALVVVASASYCNISNCSCSGSIYPGMDCSKCTGKNCHCDCPASLADLSAGPVKFHIVNSTEIVEASVCNISGCTCTGSFSNKDACQHCSGPNCNCKC